MTRIARRRVVVPLLQGNYDAELAALLDKSMAALREEASDEPTGPRRVGQGPQTKRSEELAREYDLLQAEAEETALPVSVWAVENDDWEKLALEHEPRQSIPADEEAGTAAQTFREDEFHGVNVKTFKPALLRLALLPPEPDASDAAAPTGYWKELVDKGLYARSDDSLQQMMAKGDQIIKDLGLSRTHYVKLENASWVVNVGDDALPKGFSLVSAVRQAREPDSKQPDEQE